MTPCSIATTFNFNRSPFLQCGRVTCPTPQQMTFLKSKSMCAADKTPEYLNWLASPLIIAPYSLSGHEFESPVIQELLCYLKVENPEDQIFYKVFCSYIIIFLPTLAVRQTYPGVEERPLLDKYLILCDIYIQPDSGRHIHKSEQRKRPNRFHSLLYIYFEKFYFLQLLCELYI